MKILNKDQIYQADQATLERQGISSYILMERAATRVFDWIHARLEGAPVAIHIFCGVGNNGGDGLVVARHLAEHGYHIQVYIVAYSPNRSEDFLKNLEALKDRKIVPEILEEGSPSPQLSGDDLIIDAVFGIGLNRPPAPWIGRLFETLNKSGATVLAVDIPSGLYPDMPPTEEDDILRADHVLTLGSPKLSFFFPESGPSLERWTLLDIGLDRTFLEDVEADFSIVDQATAGALYRRRKKYSHKGDYGHAILAGGSYGKIGAVSLAAEACLKSGAGLVTAWVPGCGYIPLQTRLPQVMVRTASDTRECSDLPEAEDRYTLGVGMGLGTGSLAAAAFLEWLPAQNRPVLIDADGLNLLSAHPEALENLPEGSILTPHPGEFRRLAGDWKDSTEKYAMARRFAQEHKCVLVLKGAHTVVFWQGHGTINTSGNPGMATAGSGDVLSGLLTGLLAQGYAPAEAAKLGVYLHGRAGDLAAMVHGFEALTATELIAHIGKAFQELSNAGEHSPGKG